MNSPVTPVPTTTREGSDPLGQLKVELAGSILTGMQQGDEAMVSVCGRWLALAAEAEEWANLLLGELSVLTSRADGRIHISTEELKQITGLMFSHHRDEAGFMLLIERPEVAEEP